MTCMRRGCELPATGMVGFDFFPNPATAAECGRPPAQRLAGASCGVALCEHHFEELTSTDAGRELLNGSAVHMAEEIVSRQAGCPVAHELTELVKLPMTHPSVVLREQMVTGYINRPFQALVPMGAELN